MTGLGAGAVAARFEAVRARIAAAERDAGRAPGAVTLVAVSKRQPEASVRAAWAAGQRDFGENYVQELVARRAALADLAGLRWHAIGHVQTNKARLVAACADVIHALDSARLARELGRYAAAAGRRLEVFVQVNVSGEARKAGCVPAVLGELLTVVEAEPALALRGLMTVPPAADDPAATAPFFLALRALRDAHGGVARLPGLSMGMSSDFVEAIACGATVVRVGSALFGPRAG